MAAAAQHADGGGARLRVERQCRVEERAAEEPLPLREQPAARRVDDGGEVLVDDETKLTLHGLQQHYVKLAENEKNRKLNELLDALEFNQVVIFVKSVQRAIQLDKLLQECNFPSVAIHASMKQEDRIKLYQSFKDVRRLADRAARAARAAAARLRRRPLSFAHSSSIAFSSPRTSGGAASTSTPRGRWW